MAKELGDPLHAMTLQLTETSDGTGSAGDAVTKNSSDKVTQIGSTGSDVYGILAEDSPSNGDEVSVIVFGPVAANVGSSVTSSDIVISSSTGGQLAQEGDNGKEATGGSFTGTFAPGNPFALSDSGGSYDGYSFSSNEGAIMMR
jgi:hypothetical protein